MALAPGTRIGAYEITAPLGAGGMGEVYRARDTRLSRSVAIKVLPPGLEDDPERRVRFEREARSVAALSHPNIVAVFDTGEHDGRLFVVMELLEGETLRDRLAHGVQPVRKTLEIAAQIARGLAAAHDKGLVHRDLKPANIFLLRDGQVKILDFGLARQAELAPTQETRTAEPLTGPGAVVGTAGYMSPEQVRGEAVDSRTDLFALGAVLYEMVSGRRAFHRDTNAETSTAILREDPPDLTTLRPEIAPALERIVRHCLEKNPVERFQTARDVAFALDALSGSGSASSMPIAAGSPWRRWWPAAAIVTALLAGIAAGVAGTSWRNTSASPVQFIRKTFDDSSIVNARFMPDGTTIIYSGSTGGGAPSLHEVRDSAAVPRQFGPPATAVLAISSGGELAVITDIGRRPGVWVDVGTLARMHLDGAPRAVATNISSADWSPDGKDFAVVRIREDLATLEYPIDHELYRSAGYISDLRVSPDGQRVAFMDHLTGNDNRGWVRTVDTRGTVTTLAGEFVAETGLAWSRDGRSVFFSAVDDDADPRLNVRQVAVSDGRQPSTVAVSTPGWLRVLDSSPSGDLLAASEEDRREIGAKLRGEASLRFLTWLGQSWGSSISQDGRLVLFSHSHGGPNYMTALRRTDGSPVVNLGDGSAMGISPDGQWAMAALMAASPAQLMAYPTGAGTARRLSSGGIEAYDPASLVWLPDSLTFLFRGSEPKKSARTYLQSVNGGDPRPVLSVSAHAALVSIDGTHVVASEPGESWRLYPLQGGASSELRGLKAADRPVGWSSDGRAILTTNDAVPARLERVDLATGTRSLVREVHADGHGALSVLLRNVTADGEQFAFEVPLHTSTLHVIAGVRGAGSRTR